MTRFNLELFLFSCCTSHLSIHFLSGRFTPLKFYNEFCVLSSDVPSSVLSLPVDHFFASSEDSIIVVLDDKNFDFDISLFRKEVIS